MLINLSVADILANVRAGDTTTKGVTLDWSDVLDWKADSGNFDGLALDILNDGFSPAAPLLMKHIDNALTLIDGHHRFSIAVLLGLDTVPVFIAGIGSGSMNAATADFGPRPAARARG